MQTMLLRSRVYYRLLCVLLLSFTCFYTNAQASDRAVTINGTGITLKAVFKAIKKQTGFTVMYNTTVTMLNQEEKVTVNFKDTPLDEVLTYLFKGKGLGWTYNDDVVVVHKKEVVTPVKKNEEDSTVTPALLSGRITDASGTPIPGVTVQVKGSSQGTTTDADGKFTLAKVGNGEVLVISSVGFEKREIPVKGRTVLAQLNVQVSGLDETVVKGYYNTTKRLNTGNVTTIKAEEIAKQPVSNPLAALQGRVPGMFITQNSGVPGGTFTVQIRGQNSIANGNEPLYVIDGVPYPSTLLPNLAADILGRNINTNYRYGGNPLTYINPTDIESIDILKDADATAIYGSRGANGVVLITTKKGLAGKTTVDINVYTGAGKPTRIVRLLNTQQYLEMRHESFRNDNASPQPWEADINNTWDTTRYTNWPKLLTGGSASYTDIQASLSGGNIHTQYLIGSGYHKESTVFPSDFADHKASVHFNVTASSPNEKFNAVLSGNYISSNTNLLSIDLTNFILLPPNAPPIYSADGSLNWANSTWENPLQYTHRKYKSLTNNLISNAILSYQILSGLQCKVNFGYTNMQRNEITTIPISSYNPAYRVTSGTANFSSSNIRSWIIEPQINYLLSIGKGRLTALLGVTLQENGSSGQIIEGSGITSDALLENIQAASKLRVTSATNNQYRYSAIFGRINYNWNEKYILNLIARRDGSSRFGPGRQYANFAAFGIGWIFSKENFIANHLPFVSFGKIRGSYGTSGNDQIGDYRYIDLYNSTINPYQGIQGLYPANLFTPDLAWEENKKLEAGFELGIFNDRILFTSSYYRNRSSNQLLSYPLSSVTGFTSTYANLPAKVQNSGLELTLNTTNVKTESFIWACAINLSVSRNKLVSYPDINTPSYIKNAIGKPLSIRMVYHLLGVDPATGIYQFLDSKGTPTFTPNPETDLISIINMSPKFYGGFQNTFRYKDIQLDVFFQFVKQNGNNYLFGTDSPPGMYYFNASVDVMQRWQKPGDIMPIQRFTQDYASAAYKAYSNAKQSNYAFVDASYIRLKNLSLSYQLPEKWTKPLRLKHCRIYTQGQNLLTLTPYKGIDPENQSLTAIPPLSVLTVGLQVHL